MAIEFDCPHCTTTIRVPDVAAGKKGKCPSCERVLRVPMLELPPPSSPPAAPSKPASPDVAAAVESPDDADETAAARPAWMQEKGPSVPPPPDDPSGFVEAPTDGPPDFSAFGGVDKEVGEPLIRTEPVPPPGPTTPELPPGGFPSLGAETGAPGAAVGSGPRRSRRRGRGMPSWVVPVVGVVLFGAFFAWFNWSSRPQLVGTLPATAHGFLELPPRDLDSTTAGLEPNRFEEILGEEVLPIHSNLLEVDLRVRGSVLQARVRPGSDTRFVKVSKKADAEWLEFARERKDALDSARRAELRAAAQRLNAWFTQEGGGNLDVGLQRRVRDELALDTLTGPLGTNLRAVVPGNVEFRCVYEDLDALYFLLPRAVESFEIEGRTPADLTTPIFYGRYTIEGVEVVPGERPEDWVDPWLPEEQLPDLAPPTGGMDAETNSGRNSELMFPK